MEPISDFSVIDAYARYRYLENDESYLSLNKDQLYEFKELLHRGWKDDLKRIALHIGEGGRWAVLGYEWDFEELLHALIEVCGYDKDFYKKSMDDSNPNREIFLIKDTIPLTNGDQSNLKIYVLRCKKEKNALERILENTTMSIALVSKIPVINAPKA